MKKILASGLILFVVIVFPKTSFSTTITSAGSGAWGAPATWTPSVPACGDTITILSGDVVTLESQQDYSACGSAMIVIVDGTLEFPVNGPKLRLPCGSLFIINIGGSLIATAGGGGGSSNFLEICESVVWRKADGPQSGPLVFGTPLPIDLISFEANANDDQVDLKWITASEINNNFFTVEKSLDAKEWGKIIITSGAGNSSQTMDYIETDYEPFEGISYYRLKQTDFNGEFSYSNIVPVKFVKENSDEGLISLFPNPVIHGQTVKIKFSNIFESDVLVVLRNINGQEFYSKVVINILDGKLVGIPTDRGIPAGIYLITASSENQMYSQKLIIKSEYYSEK